MATRPQVTPLEKAEETEIRLKTARRLVFVGFIPCAVFGVGLAVLTDIIIPAADLKANPGLKPLPIVIGGGFIVLGSIFPVIGWFAAPLMAAAAKRANEKKALSAGFGFCGTCGTRLAVRVDPKSIFRYSTATGWKWNWRFSRDCPKCLGIPCYFDGCSAQSETTLVSAFSVGPAGVHVTVQDDAPLCSHHYALLEQWYASGKVRRIASVVIYPFLVIGGLAGVISGWDGQPPGAFAGGVAALLVAGLIIGVNLIYEHRLSRRLFGSNPRRKPEYAITVRESFGLWSNEYF